MCNTLGAHHVQHIGRSSCARHWALIMCKTLGAHLVQDIGRLSCVTHWALIMCNTLGTHHVQHIGHSSCATHWALIMCNTSGTHHVHHFVFHLVQRGSSAIKMDRVEIAFSLVIFYGLKRLNNEEREKTGVPRENPGQQASENVTY